MKAPSHTADRPPLERPGYGIVIASRGRELLRGQTERMMRGMKRNHREFALA